MKAFSFSCQKFRPPAMRDFLGESPHSWETPNTPQPVGHLLNLGTIDKVNGDL